MAEERVLGLGFVGLGQAVDRMFQQRHELVQLPFRIAAAAETRPHALDAFRRDFGGETYDNVEDLCRSPKVDVVYVATGPRLHREHVDDRGPARQAHRCRETHGSDARRLRCHD